MRSLKLNSGATIPELGFGTWLAAPGVVQTSVEAAIKTGFRHIDCAAIYGNEKEVGSAFKQCFASGVKRSDLFVTSKLWNTFHKPSDVKPAIERTLADLGIDYLDLYLIHWPMGYENGGDASVVFPRNEDGTIIADDSDYLATWKEMEKLVAEGLVRAIGVSNFSKSQIQRCIDNSSTVPAINQVECHPYFNQGEMAEFCKKRGILLTAYSPFCNPGRPWAGTEKDGKNTAQVPLLQNETIASIASKHKKNNGHVLLRYQLDRGIVCLTKSVKPERIASNFDIFNFELDSEDMKKIDSLQTGVRMLPLDWDGLNNHKDYPFHA